MPNCKIIAIANQKGGVGKTTTTFNLGVALAKQNKNVLLIDLDPQSNLTTYAGWYDQDKIPLTITNLMEQSMNEESIQINECILHHNEKVDLIPSDLNLSALETSLAYAMCREYTLKNCLSNIKSNYDYIIIDCPPSLSMLTINALATATDVIEKINEVINEDISLEDDNYIPNITEETKEKMKDNLIVFNDRDVEVLKYRFGLFNGIEHSIDETAKYFNLTTTRIKQIEARAIRKIGRI